MPRAGTNLDCSEGNPSNRKRQFCDMLQVDSMPILAAVNQIPKMPLGASHKNYEVADSLVNSLLASNNLLPNQWAGMLGRRAENRELHLLWGVFYSAWEDLRSPRIPIRSEAARFFTEADAGKPVSLRFLCEVFDLDLNAVQLMARARIAGGVQKGRRRRDFRTSYISLLT